MTEIERYEAPIAATALTEQMDYARAVSTAALLPQAYRGKPADIMLAMGLGSAMGLTPAESLYRIDVIQGKPTASAELIAANVRKAGHKLRVRGDDNSCTATIIRADDPEFEFTVTRDVKWAQQMGLTGKDNYKKQPGTMLQWRAITAVARLACPEALYGVAYTADEIIDSPTQPSGLAAAMAPTVTAEQVHDEPAPESPTLDMRSSLAKRMFATLNEAGYADDAKQKAFIEQAVGRTFTSRKELTDADAHTVIDALTELLEQPFPEGGES